MKLISALAILLLISSCAHNKIRLVRAPKQVVTLNHEDKSATPLNSDTEEELTISLNSNGFVKVVNDNITADVNPGTATHIIDPSFFSIMEEPELNAGSYLTTPPDTTNAMTTMEKQDMYYDAMEAEDDAKSARNVLAGSFVLLVLPFFGFFLSIIFYAVGATYYKRARTARYNTVRGMEYEESARKWNIAYGIAMAVTLLLVAALLVIMFL